MNDSMGLFSMGPGSNAGKDEGCSFSPSGCSGMFQWGPA